jgi:hypothetical protein
VGLEVSAQVRPADLTATERQVRVGPPAVGGHDRAGVGEQRLGVIFVTVGRDRQDRVAFGEGAPQRAPLAGGAPAGLVHVDAGGGAHALQQIVVGILKCVSDARKDRVDRAA